MSNLFRNLLYLELEEKETVFKYGEVGELFYIIIDGEVSVKTPYLDSLEGSQTKPFQLLSYFITHFKYIDWNSIKGSINVRQMIISEAERLGVNLPSDGSYEAKLTQL